MSLEKWKSFCYATLVVLDTWNYIIVGKLFLLRWVTWSLIIYKWLLSVGIHALYDHIIAGKKKYWVILASNNPTKIDIRYLLYRFIFGH